MLNFNIVVFVFLKGASKTRRFDVISISYFHIFVFLCHLPFVCFRKQIVIVFTRGKRTIQFNKYLQFYVHFNNNLIIIDITV